MSRESARDDSRAASVGRGSRADGTEEPFLGPPGTRANDVSAAPPRGSTKFRKHVFLESVDPRPFVVEMSREALSVPDGQKMQDLNGYLIIKTYEYMVLLHEFALTPITLAGSSSTAAGTPTRRRRPGRSATCRPGTSPAAS